jgi:hypothetical protein
MKNNNIEDMNHLVPNNPDDMYVKSNNIVKSDHEENKDNIISKLGKLNYDNSIIKDIINDFLNNYDSDDSFIDYQKPTTDEAELHLTEHDDYIDIEIINNYISNNQEPHPDNINFNSIFNDYLTGIKSEEQKLINNNNNNNNNNEDSITNDNKDLIYNKDLINYNNDESINYNTIEDNIIEDNIVKDDTVNNDKVTDDKDITLDKDIVSSTVIVNEDLLNNRSECKAEIEEVVVDKYFSCFEHDDDNTDSISDKEYYDKYNTTKTRNNNLNKMGIITISTLVFIGSAWISKYM